MKRGSVAMYFAYDASGPMSVTYNGTTYQYVTNIQGDIIAILNPIGTAVVQYTYDAWGNLINMTASLVYLSHTKKPFEGVPSIKQVNTYRKR